MPASEKNAENVAAPLLSVVCPREVVPSINCTVPVGAAEVRFVLPEAKLTESVTGVPASAGFGVAVKVDATAC